MLGLIQIYVITEYIRHGNDQKNNIEKLQKMHDDIFMRDDVICLDNNEELTEDKLNDLCINIIQMLND
jgi:hypothetical protein